MSMHNSFVSGRARQQAIWNQNYSINEQYAYIAYCFNNYSFFALIYNWELKLFERTRLRPFRFHFKSVFEGTFPKDTNPVSLSLKLNNLRLRKQSRHLPSTYNFIDKRLSV